MVGYIPVSYTHLDVYKRQLYHFIPIRILFGVIFIKTFESTLTAASPRNHRIPPLDLVVLLFAFHPDVAQLPFIMANAIILLFKNGVYHINHSTFRLGLSISWHPLFYLPGNSLLVRSSFLYMLLSLIHISFFIIFILYPIPRTVCIYFGWLGSSSIFFLSRRTWEVMLLSSRRYSPFHTKL